MEMNRYLWKRKLICIKGILWYSGLENYEDLLNLWPPLWRKRNEYFSDVHHVYFDIDTDKTVLQVCFSQVIGNFHFLKINYFPFRPPGKSTDPMYYRLDGRQVLCLGQASDRWYKVKWGSLHAALPASHHESI